MTPLSPLPSLSPQSIPSFLFDAVEHGADVNATMKDTKVSTALLIAAFDGHAAIVHVLLDAGADAQAVNKDGRTALMLAARGKKPGHVAASLILLYHGADVNVVTKDGVTALMAAALGGQPILVQAMLDKGADEHVATANGNTARSFASEYKRDEIVKFFEKRDAERSKDEL